MAKAKLNFGVFDGMGSVHFFYAMMNKTSNGRTDPDGDSLTQTFQFYSAYMRSRHIDFIPNLSAGSGGISDAVNPNFAEGVWVKDELFKFNETQAIAVNSPSVSVQNQNFSDGLDGWTVLGHGAPPLGNADIIHSRNDGDDTGSTRKPLSEWQPLCSYNSTFGPRQGLGSATCTVTQDMPAEPHTLTVGISSAPFKTEAGGIYAWSVIHANIKYSSF